MVFSPQIKSPSRRRKRQKHCITVVNTGKLKSESDHIGNEWPTVASYAENPDKGMAFESLIRVLVK